TGCRNTSSTKHLSVPYPLQLAFIEAVADDSFLDDMIPPDNRIANFRLMLNARQSWIERLRACLKGCNLNLKQPQQKARQ
ncbi:MAG TPA: hypothetical protein VIJ25_12565, partial [Methylococcales bacterium]